ncbi:hypothetical protein GLOIN_2v1775407 [Rhizophagus irregularis DAOM 181602=DAOM 197198]|nr:hypothetical protein GLOIN_2v1775407 [Rhizophagus irregularis DAOM 181602=DAOM 197198]
MLFLQFYWKIILINLITNDLKSKRSNYLLLAPTGIAGTNIGDTLIIYEIPITSTLFYFISDMFSVIQQQINAFGGLNVIVVGDLAHQYNFNGFFYFVKWYNAKIDKIKICNIIMPYKKLNLAIFFMNTWTLLYKKENNFNYHKLLNTILNIKNIVGYNQTANQIHYFPISSAIDFIDNQQYNPDDAQKLFKRKLTF